MITIGDLKAGGLRVSLFAVGRAGVEIQRNKPLAFTRK
jgi:hypothetical protein